MRTASLKPAIRIAARATGWLLSLAALIFFVRLVMRQGISLSSHPPAEVLASVGIGAVVYAVAVLMLSLIWTALVQSGMRDPSVRKVLVAAYLKSQFAKYLPGNVLQYAIRHALGRQTGIGHGALAAAAILEAMLLSCAALAIVVCFGMPALQALFDSIPHIPRIYALFVLAVIPFLAWMPERLRPSWLPRYRWATIAAALAGYAFFFVVFGSLFFAGLVWYNGYGPRLLEVISSSSLAWLVGFLIPGAPAGAGLRETALALVAGSKTPSNGILTAIVLFRLMTLGGDFLAFLAGCWISIPARARGKVLPPDK